VSDHLEESDHYKIHGLKLQGEWWHSLPRMLFQNTESTAKAVVPKNGKAKDVNTATEVKDE